MNLPILTIAITHEQDIVIARRRARQIAELLEFPPQDATRISTAVSEIARNAFTYGGGGKAEFLVENATPSFVIRISDRGPGIADVDSILAGQYRSETGMGLGILGARRLMDDFEIRSAKGRGTVVTLGKHLLGGLPVTPKTLASVSKKLTEQPQDFYEEIRQQNQELLNTLGQLRGREEELIRLNRELEDTNRGVVALYSELDQKAAELRLADQMKSRFLSHVSHEFRTPLNAIVGLTRLLLKRPEIASSADAVRELNFLRRSAEGLTEMVNDLLDLAKAESGKLEVRAAEIQVSDLFATLRGMFRPLFTNEDVRLVIEEPESVPAMYTDEDKLSQILRNFLANALKFTERGEVRLKASYATEQDAIRFSVEDTGIGIPAEYLDRIFEEFSQIQNPLQHRAKGTGLGLPLCRRLAELLGGSVEVCSRPGVGSVFQAVIPRTCSATDPVAVVPAKIGERIHKVLLIDDEEISRYLLRQLLKGQCDMAEAGTGAEGLEQLRKLKPDAVFLDLNMPGQSGFEVLEAIERDPATSRTPVVIVTALKLDLEAREKLEKRVIAILSKESLARAESLSIDFGPPVSVSPRAPAG